MNKKYWQNFGELSESDAFKRSSEDEFKEELVPLENLEENGLLDGKTPRRDFLKYLGFTTAAAALAASCEMPVRKSIPYLNRPDNVIPGIPNYYASTYVNGGDAISVIVKQRDGRPIKIEGNELSSVTKGGTSAQVQASVLDLYDTIRLRYPLQKNGGDFKEVSTFEAFDKIIANAMTRLNGKPLVLLTSTIHSPSTLQIINAFITKYPGSRHVQYDAVSYSGMILANETCFGKKAIPSYHFDKAKTIVSLGADFLGSWLSPVEFNRQYAATRRITGENPTLSRHIHFESMLSLTGSNADDRIIHKPSQTGAIALALYNSLKNGSTGSNSLEPNIQKGVAIAVQALKSANGSGLVVCGSNDMNIQVIVNAINALTGAIGNTINWATTINSRQGIDSDLSKVIADMNSGAIGGLLVYDCNPVYNHPDSKRFAEGVAKLPVSISFSGTMDETTELCNYIIPSHHWLESWGDAEPKSGFISLLQPVINPLFKTRPFQTSLIKWMGADSLTVPATQRADTGAKKTLYPETVKMNTPSDEYEAYFRNYWTGKLGSADLYDKALQDGVIESSSEPAFTGVTFSDARVAQAVSSIGLIKSGSTEIFFYEKVSVGNGSQANNPWLQELPDPISKVAWDNYAMMCPELAKTLLGIDMYVQRDSDKYEVEPEKPVIKLTVNNRSVELPVLILPGLNNATVAVALGYGRQSANKDQSMDRVGRSAFGAGQNVYPFLTSDGSTLIYNSPVIVEKTGKTYPLAQTQVHGSSENRPIIFETTLSAFNKDPEALLEEPRNERMVIMADGKTDFVKDGTPYPDFAKPGIKWGMSIDLNTCTGCSACVVACTAENNVSVVGKIQVQRYHEMHWLRIDRYFTGDIKNPDVVFQPMLCQHCDNAPCENVCPVSATNHSSEGLNQMAYNRCIGTRYCANNCPYKVRRFNWLDFTGADSFPDNQKPLLNVDINESVFQMNEDLTRMVLNPDVTVRSRGVMEKCTFCVQRLQENKLEAKKQQDPSLVRNVKTACMQACPTNAIMFGNVNDKESEVYKIRNVEQVNRNFYVLEQLHVLPNVSYLAKVRNTERVLGTEKEGQHGEIHRENIHS